MTCALLQAFALTAIIVAGVIANLEAIRLGDAQRDQQRSRA